MKPVRFASIIESQLLESIEQLVERGYFSDEEYAVAYVSDLAMFFQLNLHNLVATDAPDYFKRYGDNLKYVSYRNNAHTTWYAFFQETADSYHVVYLANNHTIGHKLDLNL